MGHGLSSVYCPHFSFSFSPCAILLLFPFVEATSKTMLCRNLFTFFVVIFIVDPHLSSSHFASYMGYSRFSAPSLCYLIFLNYIRWFCYSKYADKENLEKYFRRYLVMLSYALYAGFILHYSPFFSATPLVSI